jgi:hypothetical protein
MDVVSRVNMLFDDMVKVLLVFIVLSNQPRLLDYYKSRSGRPA